MIPGERGPRWAERAFGELAAERVLFEDDDLIVVDKPAGVACQAPSEARPHDLPLRIRAMLAARSGESAEDVYLGTHQRLDQGSSGVIVYALRPSANPALAKQFEGRSVTKRYVAAVSGKPPTAGTQLSHWLRPAAGGRIEVAAGPRPDAKLAQSQIERVESVGTRSLVHVRIDTGRTHQIRVQLAACGCPLAGDALYGGETAFRLMLHAESLALAHPADARPLEFRAPLPLEFSDWLAHGVRPAYADAALFRAALEHACQRRYSEGRALAAGTTTAFRLMHEAADGVPGFGVDVYDRFLVVRVRADVTEHDERGLLRGLEQLGCEGVYLKRHPKQANVLTQASDEPIESAPVAGSAAAEPLIVREHDVPYEVRLGEGLRTGLFLDQRDNRRRIAELADGKRVLNLFAYTGSFSVVALAHGAKHVTTVDVSRTALQWAERNVERVGGSERHRAIAADAFDSLEKLAQRGERFDVIIVDPPSYATTKRGRFRVVKDYGALCRSALRVISDEGVLFACINHYGISQSTLRRFVSDAVEAQGLHLKALRDAPLQVDFPFAKGAEAPTKGVIAWVSPGVVRTPKQRTARRGVRRSVRDSGRKHPRR